jgi:hypothetical protein
MTMCAGCHIAQFPFFRFLLKTGCVPCMLFSANAGGVNTHLVQESCQWLENSFTSSRSFTKHKKDHLAMKLWKSLELVETKQFLE